VSRYIVDIALAMLLALVVTEMATVELAARVRASQNAPPTRSNAIESNPLTQALRAAFVARNPAVTRATLLELRSVGMGSGGYVLLGWGIRPDMRFEGHFDDELFGVFVVDSSLTKIERTLDIFPTRRWADYMVSIEKIADGEVTIFGQGSYGDQPLRQTYRLSEAK
jgi:hypothetical protein